MNNFLFLNYLEQEIEKITIGTEFRLRDLVPSPQAHLGRIFRQEINKKNRFINVINIGRDRESDIYKKINI